MVNMTPYNGKGCHNILIQNNSFKNPKGEAIYVK